MRRAVVAYDDLPDSPDAVAAAQPAKRRRAPDVYRGPHWDAPPSAAQAPPQAAPWDVRAPDVYDTDDAVIASPHGSDTAAAWERGDVSEDETSLTAAEVWDDQFLQEVWDGAEAEYRTFHARRAEALAAPPTAWHALPRVGASLRVPPSPPPAPPPAPAPGATPGWTRACEIVRQTPATIGGATQDEALQNVAMAWYYAGYYTALYGQR